MTPDTGRPLRVEQVLRLLPDVDALQPLRAFLVATSRRRSGVEPHLTVGKRIVRASELPEVVPQALRRVSEHLSELYRAAIAALEAEERGDGATAVREFLIAGDLELNAGRTSAARAWYDSAVMVAEGLRDRRPEMSVLRRIGELEVIAEDLDRAARVMQRCFALAEAEGDAMSAAAAALALGRVALARQNMRGATAWFARGSIHAAEQPSLLGQLALGRSTVALASGDLDEAERRAREATDQFASVSDAAGIVDVLATRGRIAARRRHATDAVALLREALAYRNALPTDPRAELAIRIELSQVFLDGDRLPDAEDEVRKAEELAISHNDMRSLARVYILLGGLRGRQRDESGFVFFEKAIELSRLGEPQPRVEARAYLEYGRFRSALGDLDEARAYFERAREIVETASDPDLETAIDATLRLHARA